MRGRRGDHRPAVYRRGIRSIRPCCGTSRLCRRRGHRRRTREGLAASVKYREHRPRLQSPSLGTVSQARLTRRSRWIRIAPVRSPFPHAEAGTGQLERRRGIPVTAVWAILPVVLLLASAAPVGKVGPAGSGQVPPLMVTREQVNASRNSVVHLVFRNKGSDGRGFLSAADRRSHRQN